MLSELLTRLMWSHMGASHDAQDTVSRSGCYWETSSHITTRIFQVFPSGLILWFPYEFCQNTKKTNLTYTLNTKDETPVRSWDAVSLTSAKTSWRRIFAFWVTLYPTAGNLLFGQEAIDWHSSRQTLSGIQVIWVCKFSPLCNAFQRNTAHFPVWLPVSGQGCRYTSTAYPWQLETICLINTLANSSFKIHKKYIYISI